MLLDFNRLYSVLVAIWSVQCAVQKMNSKIVATVKPRFFAIPRERRTFKYNPNMTTYAPEIIHFSPVYHSELSLP
jgi:hypothetical protein